MTAHLLTVWMWFQLASVPVLLAMGACDGGDNRHREKRDTERAKTSRRR